MKKIITLCGFFLSLYSSAQIKALTDEGVEVVLFENGSWKFVNESDAKILETIKSNTNVFEKSKDANFLMKSKRLDVGIYFNTKKWKIQPQNISPYVEYYFSDINLTNTVYSFLMTEKLQISNLKNLKDILIQTVQKKVDYFRLKESEYRTVNGLKVLYLRYSANTKGLDFEYAGYYYIDESGYCGVVGFSPLKDFEENFNKIQEFLNGIVKTDKAVVKEVVEFTSPPPPMNKN